ncbi:MAG: c-type cytochrome [Planctomycetota bacterium]
MTVWRLLLSLVVLASTLLSSTASAQLRGWTAESGTDGSLAWRAENAAFTLDAGETWHPALESSAPLVSYMGDVEVRIRGRYRFGIEVEGGKATLEIEGTSSVKAEPGTNGAIWSSPVALEPGRIEVRVHFERDQDASSRLRTMWQRLKKEGDDGFRPEPIPSDRVFVPDDRVAVTEEAASARDGRVLLGELGCVSCHALSDAQGNGILTREGPRLDQVGQRLGGEWLRRWIRDPQTLKPGSGMPTLFGDDETDRADIDALVAYLTADAPAEPGPGPATEEPVLRRGERLYHQLGCVACHGAFAPAGEVYGQPELGMELPEATPSIPFGDLKGKWRLDALAAFLRDPLQWHPSARMPRFSLTREESDLLATYLGAQLGVDAAPAPSTDEGLRKRGEVVFLQRGCVNCHAWGELKPTLEVPPLDALEGAGGCLDAGGSFRPRYLIGDADRQALKDGLREAAVLTGAPAPLDEHARRLEAYSCRSCHELGGEGGVSAELSPYFQPRQEVDLGDEGRLPPRLTGVGFKLRTEWIQEVLLRGGQARPYLGVRMPQYAPEGASPDHPVGQLAVGFARREGLHPYSDAQEPEPTDAMALAGRQLMGQQGFSCWSCHSFADVPTNSTPGPNITEFAGRLRYAWWRDYVHDPARFKPGTRMPRYFTEGKSLLTSILDGDAEAQADALWAYFTLGEFAPLPPGLEPRGTTALVVGDRPRIFRTFLRDAGSRGIAVGYPIGIHFAFDANAVRLAESWMGDFLDASGAWNGRGGQVSGGQGTQIWKAPPGPPLVIGDPPKPDEWPEATGSDAGYEFKGYRLDEAGVPTFRYAIATETGEVFVEERFEPAERSGAWLMRSFTLRNLTDELWINLGPGETNLLSRENARVDEIASDADNLLHVRPIDVDRPVKIQLEIKP